MYVKVVDWLPTNKKGDRYWVASTWKGWIWECRLYDLAHSHSCSPPWRVCQDSIWIEARRWWRLKEIKIKCKIPLYPFWWWYSFFLCTTLLNQTGLITSIGSPHLPVFGYLTGWISDRKFKVHWSITKAAKAYLCLLLLHYHPSIH